MLKRNLVANYLGQGWSALMGLAFVPLYIKYLGVEAYGLIGLFAMIQAWMAIVDSGVVSALGREMARFSGGAHDALSIRSLLRTIEIIVITLCAGVSLVIYGTAGWLAQHWFQASHLSAASVQQALSIIGAVVGLRIIENIYRSCLVGLQRQVTTNIVASFMATVRGLGAVGILAWVDPSISTYFIWQGAVSIVTSVIFAFATYRVLPPTKSAVSFTLNELSRVRKFIGGVSGITILALLLTQLDKLLMTRLLTLEQFGVYALATTVASVLFMLVGPITQTYYPRFVELITRRDLDTLAASFHQSTQLVTVSVGPAAIMMALFGTPLLVLWTANPALAEKTGTLLPVVAIGTMFNAFMYLPVQMQLAHGWTSLVLRTNTIAVLILVPAIFIAVPAYGAIGAAWIWLLLNLAYVLGSVFIMFRKILTAERFSWYVRDLMIPMISGIAVAVLGKLVFSPEASRLAQIFILVLIWIGVVAATLGMAPMVRGSAHAYIKRFLRSRA